MRPTHHKRPSIIIGRQPVLEALQAGKQIERVFFQKNISGDSIFTIRQLCTAVKVPINVVPVEKLNSLSRSNHQGVIAIAGLISYMDIQDVIDHLFSAGEIPFFLMLDGITDVRNIGAIARSALCTNAQALIIPDKGVAAINEEAMKSSAGALNNIHVCRVDSLLKTIDTLHLNGIKVYTAEMKAESALDQIDFTQPCCIIMGSEDKGVQSFLSKAADQRFIIPMSDKFDSFNVSVAAGIVLYAGFRQRNV